jgi:hypothetical protein
MPRSSIETAGGWRDRTMADREGVLLGRIAHIYLDEVTGEPEWALVVTGQGGRQVFVPLVDAAERQDQIRVPVERALVSDAPAIRARRQLSKEDTARLHGYYGGAPELRWEVPGGCRAAGQPPVSGRGWTGPGSGFQARRRSVLRVPGGCWPLLPRRRRRWPAACWLSGAVGESGRPAWPARLVGPWDRCLPCPPGRCVGVGCVPWLGRRPRPSPRPGGPWPGPAATCPRRPGRVREH